MAIIPQAVPISRAVVRADKKAVTKQGRQASMQSLISFSELGLGEGQALQESGYRASKLGCGPRGAKVWSRPRVLVSVKWNLNISLLAYDTPAFTDKPVDHFGKSQNLL